MKCLYYLSPSLDSTEQISNDLHDVGVEDFFVHVIAKDESGLKKRQIHSSNYLETLDIVRDGFIGAAIGFVSGLLGVMLLERFGPFPNIPGVVYVALAAVATLFGAWVGGLVGVEKENKKLARFHDDIEAGKYLVLIYARKGQGQKIQDMMADKHPEAVLAGEDTHFVNPFTAVQGRRRREAGRLAGSQGD